MALLGLTVAVSCSVLPMSPSSMVLFRDTPVGFTLLSVTLTMQTSRKPPSSVVAPITARPALLPVTRPRLDTEATSGALLEKETLALAAFAGSTVGFKMPVPPTEISNDGGYISMRVTAAPSDLAPTVSMALRLAVGAACTLLLPSYIMPVAGVTGASNVAEILAVPLPLAVTRPLLGSTAATAGLSDSQVTFWFVALEGMKFSARAPKPPSVMYRSFLLRYAPLAGMGAATTSMEHSAIILPLSCDFAVTVAVPSAKGVTTPFAETVAMFLRSLSQVTFLLVALWGEMTGNRVPGSFPAASVMAVRFSVRPVTATGAGGVLPPPQDR